MFINLTVAIPTYNGANRLPQVLERIQAQKNIENLNWEIIVVDNNSKDNTAKLIQEYQKKWQHSYPLRYVFEPKQGLAFARQRAIEEAKGELVAFLDDDNIPALNWVSEVYKFGQKHPQAGAYASQIHGLFEVEPPEYLKSIIFYLAITERGCQPLLYEPRKKGFPPGAGLVVRRDVWKQNVPKHLLFSGRTGKSLVSSEDTEALLYIYHADWEIWYNPEMEIEHVIPSSRLEKKYFMGLMRSIGLPHYYFRMALIKPWQRPFLFFMYLLNDIIKLIIHLITYRKVLNADVTAAYEKERLIGILQSPFYLAHLKLLNVLNSVYKFETTNNT
ncbi:MAG: hormogonium polysaccharide biosynthesis glycosyltransferase HpsE [Calothrix sp. MO_167.B12]|nr:hormogonium polysaccharide biosynthesis glycosyltransferase HpsE [Calothrix sp. MO_167.B12]